MLSPGNKRSRKRQQDCYLGVWKIKNKSERTWKVIPMKWQRSDSCRNLGLWKIELFALRNRCVQSRFLHILFVSFCICDFFIFVSNLYFSQLGSLELISFFQVYATSTFSFKLCSPLYISSYKDRNLCCISNFYCW